MPSNDADTISAAEDHRNFVHYSEQILKAYKFLNDATIDNYSDGIAMAFRDIEFQTIHHWRRLYRIKFRIAYDNTYTGDRN